MTKRKTAAVAIASSPVVADLAEFEREFLLGLRARYQAEFERLRAAGADVARLGDPDELAARVAASTPLAPSPWEEITGPFYDTAGLTAWLGISRQALGDRVKHLSIFGLQTGDGQWVYPAWQFSADRAPIPHLAELLRILAHGTADRWTWLLWLTAPSADGALAYEVLASGKDAAALLAEARADAARWAA